MTSPNSPREVRYEVYAARSVYDTPFRQVLNDAGVSTEGSIRDVKERLSSLDTRDFQKLANDVKRMDLANPAAVRDSAFLYALNQESEKHWSEAKAKLAVDAERIKEGVVAEARADLRKGNLESFHEKLPQIRDEVKIFSTAIRESRGEVSDKLREWLSDQNTRMNREQQRTLLEEKLLDQTIPPNMQAVLNLENTLAQEEVEFVMQQQKRDPGQQSAPKASMRP